jgi:NAD(P)-dependent dehydrogenase (short-subunit alcohol dehydrogenase family)
MALHSKTAIVVGASSGVGAAVARLLAGEARKVAVLARRQEELDGLVAEVEDAVGATRVFAYRHDVVDFEGVDALFERIERELGEVDELHYVAGVMPPVEIDEFPTAKDAAMVAVQLMGCIAWGNAAARRFLARGSGHIVGVTSVAADRGRRDRPGYNASKAGQDAYLESIRNRLWRHGVYVTTVRLGTVRTPMTEGLELPMPITAERAARGILRARSRRRAVAYVPARWRLVMLVIKSIPSFLFRRLDL